MRGIQNARSLAASLGIAIVGPVACSPLDVAVFETPESEQPTEPTPIPGSSSGGTFGMGGTVGAPEPPPLGGAPNEPAPASILLDDYDDGDTRALEPPSWWYVFNDGTGNQTLGITEHVDPAEAGSYLRTEGAGFTTWGAAIGLDVAALELDGVDWQLEFRARAASPLGVELHVIDGTGEHFSRAFEVDEVWRTFAARFDQLYVVDGEQVLRLDPTTIDELHWFVFTSEPFDLCIDDVRIVRR